MRRDSVTAAFIWTWRAISRSKETVKKLLDLMAFYKLNRFHLASDR